MNGRSHGAIPLADAVRELYSAGQTDYWLDPIVLIDPQSKPIGRIGDGDSVVFCCRRGEREIELTEAFTDPQFGGFPRPLLPDLKFVILTLYHEKFFHLPVAFAPARVSDTLGAQVARAGLRQLRVSESEKFAHITFFLNGGNNQPFSGETDLRIPSRKDKPFDQIPELSLEEVSKQVMEGIRAGHDLIVTNFANGDVIGHTSNNDAKLACAGIVDHWLGQVTQAARAANYVTLITADHGNLEEMTNQDGTPNVAHTTNLVPFILMDPAWTCSACLRDGKLADIAPTILAALGLPKPDLMDGETLAPAYPWGEQRKVLLIILDGWGIGRKDNSNPIHLADTPYWDSLLKEYPFCYLHASGEFVGLKSGKAGNSEAGHMNMGAGRVVLQDDVRLDQAMKDGTFFGNEVLCQAIQYSRQHNKNLHLIGLLTEKSSHGSIDYPLALLQMAKDQGLSSDNVFLHLIFDGRSTAPGSAPDLLEMLEKKMTGIGIGRVVTGMGRGYALDRDANYSRIQRAYEALVKGEGKKYPDRALPLGEKGAG